MIVDQATFISIFPEFGDETVFTPTAYAFWEAEAERELPLSRFGSSLPLAIMLWVAHQLALSARSAQAYASGAAPGGSVSAVASKSVDGVSVSFDTSDSSLEGAGEWNATSYGQRFYRLLKSFGTGPLYVPQVSSPPRIMPLGPFGYRPF